MIELNDSIAATSARFFSLPTLPDPSLDEAIRLYEELRNYDARLIMEAHADVIISLFQSKDLGQNELDRLKTFCIVGLLEPAWSGEANAVKKIARVLLMKLGLLD